MQDIREIIAEGIARGVGLYWLKHTSHWSVCSLCCESPCSSTRVLLRINYDHIIMFYESEDPESDKYDRDPDCISAQRTIDYDISDPNFYPHEFIDWLIDESKERLKYWGRIVTTKNRFLLHSKSLGDLQPKL